MLERIIMRQNVDLYNCQIILFPPEFGKQKLKATICVGTIND